MLTSFADDEALFERHHGGRVGLPAETGEGQ